MDKRVGNTRIGLLLCNTGSASCPYLSPMSLKLDVLDFQVTSFLLALADFFLCSATCFLIFARSRVF